MSEEESESRNVDLEENEEEVVGEDSDTKSPGTETQDVSTSQKVAKSAKMEDVDKEVMEFPVLIPSFEPSSSQRLLTNELFDMNSPKIKSQESRFQVPGIRILRPIALDGNILFDLSRHFSTHERTLVIPKFVAHRTYSLVARIEFDDTLHAFSKITTPSSGYDVLKPSPKATSAVPSVGGGEGDEPFDFLKLAFGVEGKKLKGRGSKIILFLDSPGNSYLNLLQQICLRIYREIYGGEPKIRKISAFDEFWKAALERLLAQNERVTTVDLDGKEKDRYSNRIDLDQLADRLEEFRDKNLGFIIFRTAREQVFNDWKKKLGQIETQSNHKITGVRLECKPLNEDVANFLWADALENPLAGKFDQILNDARAKYEDRMEAIKGAEHGLFKSSTRRMKVPEDEGKEHFDIKIFLVRYIVRDLRKKGRQLNSRDEIMREVKTEEYENGVTPDIEYSADSRVYEIETLFGKGDEPDKQIDHTIEKYEGNPKKAINIVLDNLGFLLHLADIERIHRDFPNRNVSFYTLSFREGGTVVSLAEVERLARKWPS